MKLGMVTYNMGKDMDLPTLLEFCEKTRLEGVELRTTHAHGVEVEMNAQQRMEVRQRFEHSPVRLVQLGSTYDFHTPDQAELRKSVEGAKVYAQLAHDVGASGIKVRPNGLPEGVPVEKTLEQIGKSIGEVARSAEGIGVEVRLEVHGKGTSELPHIKTIMDHASHPMAVVNWNSNPVDMDANGSIDASFNLVKDKIRHVHMRDLGVQDYPWQDLFNKLKSINYDGYCCAEIAFNPEPERFMHAYRTLFDLYTGDYHWPRK
ncbi:MAG: hypothetical protein AMXMBFR84_18620 [Candidatus Hydrogenedentota bacterium]